MQHPKQINPGFLLRPSFSCKTQKLPAFQNDERSETFFSSAAGQILSASDLLFSEADETCILGRQDFLKAIHHSFLSALRYF